MSLGQEEVSLKILRLLYQYQYQKQNPDSGLDEKTLVDRFDFIDQDDGQTIIRNALSKLIKIGIIQELKKDHKLLYTITEKGIKHYGQFKFLTEEDMPAPGVMVMGDWYGDHRGSNSRYAINKSGINYFPGETEEFIPHYDELLKLIKEIEGKALDIKGAEVILDDLANMKVVISQDSSALGGKIRKMEELIDRLKTKIEKEVSD